MLARSAIRRLPLASFARSFQMAAAPRLTNKVAIVTGAASGIGRGIAEKFAAHGARVVIADLNGAGAQSVASTLPAAFGIGVDVSDEAAVQRVVDETVAKYGRVDILVSNAGFQHIAAVEEFPYNVFRKMMDVHVGGTFLFARACLQAMKKQIAADGAAAASSTSNGKLIFMGSIHSKEASVLKSAYVAAKHALLGFTRAVSKEAGPSAIGCNLICPGFVLTPLVQKQIPEQAKTLGISEKEVIKNVMLKATVDGEFSTIDDIAETALFFAAHPTNALTGQSINVSHGWHMD